MEDKKYILKNFIAPTSIVGDGTRTKEKYGSSWRQEKTKGLWTIITRLYPDEDEEQDEGF